MSQQRGKMSRQDMLNIVRQELTDSRYQHTLGVVQSALDLARRYGANEEKAEVAAIFHDYAKYRPLQEMKRLIETVPDIPNDLLAFQQELWHAFVGAYLVKERVGIDDREILDAIRYHTTGRENMTVLEKVVCLADYIEPGRNFPGVDEVRRLARLDLNRALAKSLHNTIRFLKDKGEKVYPLTLRAYESLEKELLENE